MNGGSPKKPPRRRVFQSTGLTPAAATRTSTSVGLVAGFGPSVSRSTSGPPSSVCCTARIVAGLGPAVIGDVSAAPRCVLYTRQGELRRRGGHDRVDAADLGVPEPVRDRDPAGL